jgi:hypothetical protein
MPAPAGTHKHVATVSELVRCDQPFSRTIRDGVRCKVLFGIKPRAYQELVRLPCSRTGRPFRATIAELQMTRLTPQLQHAATLLP